MLLLLLIAWAIAWWHDRRGPAGRGEGEWSDEDGAPIDDPPSPIERAVAGRGVPAAR